MASEPTRFGRFLPPDPRVEEPYLLTPKMAFRVAILGGVAIVVFAILFLRLWTLQILSGDVHAARANLNLVRHVRVEARRGDIVDRHGRTLVTTVASTKILLYPAELPDGSGRDTELRRLSELLNIPLAEIKAEIKAKRNDPLTPVTLKRSAREQTVQYLLEHQAEFPGVTTGDSYLRRYHSQALAAHVLGYPREVSEEQLKRLRRESPKAGYAGGDQVGQTGVEAAYDFELRGTPGQESVFVNSRNAVESRNREAKVPVGGHTVRLTIDIELQRAAERAIQYGIDLAHEQDEWAANAGSIVALDPNNGEILALANFPTYKPSVFVGRTDRKKVAPLLEEKEAAKQNYPALNRATAGTYPPGSTFKPMTAIAALQEHLIAPYQTLPCTGQYVVRGRTGEDQIFKNWDPGVNQPMNLPVALANSCDTYFYELGHWFYGLPPDRGHPLQNWASRLGFGVPTGVDVGPESEGLLPTPEWRKKQFKDDPIERLWKPGDSIQLAIGQKDLLATPLQMARFYALLANGGKLVTPHVVQSIEKHGAVQENVGNTRVPPPVETGVDPNALSVIRDGLYQATHASYGTSVGVFGNFEIDVCGKTGTAEKVVSLRNFTGLRDQAWWVGWAPCDNPKIVVAVLIENGGHGGSVAAPAAAQVIAKFFQVPPPELGDIHSD